MKAFSCGGDKSACGGMFTRGIVRCRLCAIRGESFSHNSCGKFAPVAMETVDSVLAVMAVEKLRDGVSNQSRARSGSDVP